MYLSHFTAKQGTKYKNIRFKQGTQITCYSSGLIYYGPANRLFRRKRSCANYFAIIIIYYEVFFYYEEFDDSQLLTVVTKNFILDTTGLLDPCDIL